MKKISTKKVLPLVAVGLLLVSVFVVSSYAQAPRLPDIYEELLRIGGVVDEIKSKLDVDISDELMDINWLLENVYGMVDDIELKLDPGGDFYEFVANEMDYTRWMVEEIEDKLDFGGSFYNFVEDWFMETIARLDEIWRLQGNIHGWASLVEALDEIKFEIEDIADEVGYISWNLEPGGDFYEFVANEMGYTRWMVDEIEDKLDPGGSFYNFVEAGFMETIARLDEIWRLQGNIHGWANIREALDDIKDELGQGLVGEAIVGETTTNPGGFEGLLYYTVPGYDFPTATPGNPKKLSLWIDLEEMSDGDRIEISFTLYSTHQWTPPGTHAHYMEDTDTRTFWWTFADAQGPEYMKLIIDELPIATSLSSGVRQFEGTSFTIYWHAIVEEL